MNRLHPALLALLTAPELAPRPDTVSADAWRDLPPLDLAPMPFVIADDPPPRNLPEAPYATPPNRAQRRAARKRR
jgi:hypothetical protein